VASLSGSALVERDEDRRLLAARLVTSRRPGQWVGAVAVLVLFAMLVHTVITNPRFQWGTVGDYFVNGSIMRGLVLTLWLTAAVMSCGFLLGIGLAAMRLSANRPALAQHAHADRVRSYQLLATEWAKR